MDASRALARFLRRARVRWMLADALAAGAVTLLFALAAGALAVAASRLVSFALPAPWLAGGIGASVAVAAVAAALLRHRGLLRTAVEVDARAGWKERASSLVALPAVREPMEAALAADVHDRLRTARLSALFPWRVPKLAWWSPVAGLALALAFLIPELDLLGRRAEDLRRAEEARRREEAVERLERASSEARRLPTRAPAPEVREAADRLSQLATELSQDPQDRRDALARVGEAADEIQRQREGLEGAQAAADRIRRALSQGPSDPTGEMGRNLLESRFHEAAQELAELRNRMSESSLDPETSAALQEQLAEMQRRLEGDESLSDLADAMGAAIEGLETGDETDLEALQQLLDSIDADLAQIDALEGMLDELEELRMALAEDEGLCPECQARITGFSRGGT